LARSWTHPPFPREGERKKGGKRGGRVPGQRFCLPLPPLFQGGGRKEKKGEEGKGARPAGRACLAKKMGSERGKEKTGGEEGTRGGENCSPALVHGEKKEKKEGKGKGEGEDTRRFGPSSLVH